MTEAEWRAVAEPVVRRRKTEVMAAIGLLLGDGPLPPPYNVLDSMEVFQLEQDPGEWPTTEADVPREWCFWLRNTFYVAVATADEMTADRMRKFKDYGEESDNELWLPGDGEGYAILVVLV